MRVTTVWGRALLGAAVASVCTSAGFGSLAQDTAHWKKYESMLASNGLMRTDRDPADVPYTNADLVGSFHAIMLHHEHARPGAAARPLRKLDPQVRMSISGSTINGTDIANIRSVTERLRGITGVSLIESNDDPVIQLMVLTDKERQEFARKAAPDPRWDFIAQNVANNLSRMVCGAYYSQDPQRPGYFNYIIVIPAEVTGVLRQSCIEEELGQAFGAGADSAHARPSIFNDDAEFALMTKHDEDLLRILYDPRLKAGMTAEQAMPVVHGIVEELQPAQPPVQPWPVKIADPYAPSDPWAATSAPQPSTMGSSGFDT